MWIVVGVLLWVVLMLVVSPFFHTPSFVLGSLGGVVGLGAFWAAIDVWAVGRARRAASRERAAADAHLDEAPPPP
jgi:hypothetical protein